MRIFYYILLDIKSVFYMQDGQNLFDMYASYAGEWMVDEAIADMMDNGYEGTLGIMC